MTKDIKLVHDKTILADGTVLTYEEFKEWCKHNYLPSEIGKAYARGNC